MIQADSPQKSAGPGIFRRVPPIADAGQVLLSLVPIDREVRHGEHRFLAWVQPYRTSEEDIEGVVLTERKRADELLRTQIDELQRFTAVAVGGETRMIELKEEANELCRRLGEEPRYRLEAGRDDTSEPS